MKQEDIETIERVLRANRAILGDVKTIVALSPIQAERDLLIRVFPDATIKEYRLENWNLDDKCPDKEDVDLLMVSNTFMSSSNVALWLKHVLKKAKVVVMQELIRAWRNGGSETDPTTGDRMRFCMRPTHLARIDDAFDLNTIADQILAIEFYRGDSGTRIHDGREMDALKFVALIERKKVTPVVIDVIKSIHVNSQDDNVSEFNAPQEDSSIVRGRTRG